VTSLKMLQQKRDEIKRIAAKHGAVQRPCLRFGRARDDDIESDIDLLIEKGPTTSSWFPAGLILDLEEILGRKVDIVTEAALYPALRNSVLQESGPL